jgi:hypothetical protein
MISPAIHRGAEVGACTLKRALEAEGLICRTPGETFKAAYQAGWINEDELQANPQGVSC